VFCSEYSLHMSVRGVEVAEEGVFVILTHLLVNWQACRHVDLFPLPDVRHRMLVVQRRSFLVVRVIGAPEDCFGVASLLRTANRQKGGGLAKDACFPGCSDA
jgi:hypothetical protein